jgi:hypothetical protein
MADNVWSSAGSTDFNTAGNWSLGHVPDITENALFDATSVINCTMTAAISVISLTIVAAYTGNFSSAGYKIDSVGTVTTDGTGTFSLGTGTVEISSDGSLHLGTGIGTTTISDAALIMRGSGNLDIDKANARFGTIDMAYSGKTVVQTGGSGYGCYYNGTTRLGLRLHGGTLTLNGAFNITINGSGAPYTIDSGSVINGTAAFVLVPNFGGTITLNAITLSGSGSGHKFDYNANAGGSISINQQGDISAPVISLSNNSSTVSPAWTTNGYSITATRAASAASIRGHTWAMGSSTLSFAGGVSIYNSAMTVINPGTSTWAMGGSLSLGANTVWNRDAETITFTNTATLTSAGKSLYNVVLNAATKTITMADAFHFNRLLLEPGTQITSLAGATDVIDNYTSGDWDGSAGNLTKIRSSSAGTKGNWTVLAGIITEYVDVQDNAVSNTVVDLNGTLSNTTNWLLSAVAMKKCLSHIGTRTGSRQLIGV